MDIAPSEPEVEKSVIVSILLDREHREKAFELLEPEDFYKTANRIIFEKCQELDNGGEIIQTEAINKALTAEDRKYVNGTYLGGLTEISETDPLAVDIKHYASKLKTAAQNRRAIELANAIIKNAGKNDAGKVEELSKQLIVETDEEETAPEAASDGVAFPFRVMTGAAGYFANCYGQTLEVPQTFLFFGYLTLLGNVLSSRLRLKSELNTQPRLFTVLVGESALDRKSTALQKIDNHFKSIVSGFSSCWGVGSAEGLQKKLKKDNDPINPKGTVLIFDELKAFVSKCKIDTSVLLPCVNTLYESNRYHAITKKTSVEIENAHLSLLAASTLQTYERIYNSSFIDIGFPNRVFLVIGTGRRKFSIPEKISAEDIESMKNNLIKVLKHVGPELELDIDSDAREFYHDWYLNMESSTHARRLDTYSLRFMMLLAANSLKNSIDLETTKQATDLCDWQLNIRKIHDPVDADSQYAQMEEKIRRKLQERPLKDRNLKVQTHAYRAGLHIYDSALKNLRRHKEIGWDKRHKRWFYAKN